MTIIVGDCVEAMAAMDEASADSCVTDPPYGLEFMGREWDGADGFRRSLNEADVGRESVHGRSSRTSPEYRAGHLFQEWCERWAREAFRVLKPGGHLLAFGGTRTYHRLACGLEDAGFEIRDSIAWLYGSGFPKSLDVSKAIDKAAGAEREVVGPHPTNSCPGGEWCTCETDGRAFAPTQHSAQTAPATEDAARWEGWGTALKPAHEQIVVARKPLVGTVAANVQRFGTGAINVDGCRIGTDGATTRGDTSGNRLSPSGAFTTGHAIVTLDAGRWPANVVLDEEAAAMLDAQSGISTSTGGSGPASRGRLGARVYGEFEQYDKGQALGNHGGLGDTGGASRFYYVAKASRAERNAGLDGWSEKMPHDGASHVHADGRAWDIPGSHATARANSHPTVKPIDLMRWLVRLVTPPGGTILEPFAGSGTTLIAAHLEGFHTIGIEQDADYAAIAEARLKFWQEHGEDGLGIVAQREQAAAVREAVAESGQISLLDLA